MTDEQMKTIFDNGKLGDERFVLEEDENGILYETTNAQTRSCVNSYAFMGWGDDYLNSEKWLDELTELFEGNRDVARRYVAAALDEDK